jgi:hypothetical protein
MSAPSRRSADGPKAAVRLKRGERRRQLISCAKPSRDRWLRRDDLGAGRTGSGCQPVGPGPALADKLAPARRRGRAAGRNAGEVASGDRRDSEPLARLRAAEAYLTSTKEHAATLRACTGCSLASRRGGTRSAAGVLFGCRDPAGWHHRRGATERRLPAVARPTGRRLAVHPHRAGVHADPTPRRAARRRTRRLRPRGRLPVTLPAQDGRVCNGNTPCADLWLAPSGRRGLPRQCSGYEQLTAAAEPA